MTFFVCFYNQHVFGRYNKIYDLNKRMCNNCLEAMSFVRIQMPIMSVQRKIAKLICASAFMFFFERSEAEDVDDSSMSTREFTQIRQLQLLTDREIEHLEEHCDRYKTEALPSLIALQWAMDIMRKQTPDPETRDDMLAGFYGRVYSIRRCQAEVCQILDLPMPFQYFHIMNLMLVLNLVLWAYSLGCQDSFFAPCIYMFVQMMFQGIRELSTALSNPYGEDEVDFPVTDWMLNVYARTYGLLYNSYDVKKLDLNTITPLLSPDLVRENNMIDMYVDIKPEDKPSDQQYAPVRQNEYSDEEESQYSE